MSSDEIRFKDPATMPEGRASMSGSLTQALDELMASISHAGEKVGTLTDLLEPVSYPHQPSSDERAKPTPEDQVPPLVVTLQIMIRRMNTHNEDLAVLIDRLGI